VIASLTGVTTADAQDGALRIDLGATAATPWVRDGNGTSVREGIGGFAGIEVRLRREPTGETNARFIPSLLLRVGAAPLRGTAEGQSWDAGSAVQGDLSLGVEYPVARRTTARLGVVHSWIRGPDDVTPFRRELGALRGWGLDASIARGSWLPLDLGAVAGVHLLRAGSRVDAATDVDAGWVARVRIGVRYAR
jgi:hypothetical protein